MIRGGPPLDFEFEGLPAPSHTDLMVSPEDVEWQLSEAEKEMRTVKPSLWKKVTESFWEGTVVRAGSPIRFGVSRAGVRLWDWYATGPDWHATTGNDSANAFPTAEAAMEACERALLLRLDETAPPLAQAIVPQAIVEAEQQMIDQTVSVPHHDSAREPVDHCPVLSDDATHRI